MMFSLIARFMNAAYALLILISIGLIYIEFADENSTIHRKMGVLFRNIAIISLNFLAIAFINQVVDTNSLNYQNINVVRNGLESYIEVEQGDGLNTDFKLYPIDLDEKTTIKVVIDKEIRYQLTEDGK